LLALVTASVTFFACHPLLRLLHRTARYDVPNHRSSHSAPTPRGGGIAVAAGALTGALVVALRDLLDWGVSGWVAISAVVVLAAVGFADDVRGLPPLMRLVGQVVVGAVAGLVIGGGVGGAAVGAVVVPAAVNMVNFMDGINGLCASHAAVWGVGGLLAAQAGGSATLALLGAVSLGGGLGFIPWNAPRARLFLGDVGSYLFGGLAGVGVIAALPSGQTGISGAQVMALVCAPYLLFAVDTATALVRRLLAGEPLLEAHRSHVYQRLVNEGGLPHWVVSAMMAAASLLVTLATAWSTVAGLVTGCIVVVGYLASPRLRHVAVTA
jgi:UDP-N-acetylmuramyl pentapeptide phosphotransferase/UDP-N-acetylglucosamine-1-phosphate transferase